MSDLELMITAYERACEAYEKQNQDLRDECGRLRQALRIAVFLDDPNSVQQDYERWSLLVDEGLKQNFNEWYGVQVLAALTPVAGGGGNE